MTTPQPLGDWRRDTPRDRPILVTGVAGFIGFHLSRLLLDAGFAIHGFDSLSDYYDVRLKQDRLAEIADHSDFTFHRGDLCDAAALTRAFDAADPRIVVHLAAQAGVRYSLDHPEAYGAANLTGFLNLLEVCRGRDIAHLLYASSSSVYGGNARKPFSVRDGVDHPVNLYAATKKANELMAHAYSHLYGLPATGLRFFTVYGPWGRPDMAYWLFADALMENRPLLINNDGAMARDFTYVDDVVEAVARLMPRPPRPDPDFDRTAPNPATSWAPHRVFNIGNTRPEPLMRLVALIEQNFGREGEKVFRSIAPGEVIETWADVAELEAEIGYRPETSLEIGIARFVAWHRDWRARRPPIPAARAAESVAE